MYSPVPLSSSMLMILQERKPFLRETGKRS
jgi:hypothetical protein